MEIVDRYDKKRFPLNKTSERHDKVPGEYRLSVHVWIINSKGEFLLQKRSPKKKKYPNCWAMHGGGVDTGENTVEAGIRECYEEIGVTLDENDFEFLLSFRHNPLAFVDVYLARKDVDLKDLVLEPKEVCDAKWYTMDEMEAMVKNGEMASIVCNYFDMFKKEMYNEL